MFPESIVQLFMLVLFTAFSVIKDVPVSTPVSRLPLRINSWFASQTGGVTSFVFVKVHVIVSPASSSSEPIVSVSWIELTQVAEVCTHPLGRVSDTEYEPASNV